MSDQDLPEPLSGKFEKSFAYTTIKDRLPIILIKVIDHLHREHLNIAKNFGEDAGEETKSIIGRLSELRTEMVTNKLIRPLKSNGPDVCLWNSYLKQQQQLYGFEPAWFDSPWLYSECYLYRRIKEAFELSSTLQSYDPFRYQKKDSLILLLPETIALATVLHESVAVASAAEDDKVVFEEFRKFFEICLWGNRFDLSIAAGSTARQNSTGLLELGALRDYIISNQTEDAWTILKSAASKTQGNVRLDLVLDNAGYELFTDLCLLEFLDSLKMIGRVHLYVKMIPWFVSDTLKSDIDFMLETLKSQQDDLTVNYAKKWENNITSGKWVIEQENFWTLPHDYSEMKAVDPDLYNKLSESNLIIFKGDLNYRKLTSDRKWRVTIPFVTSLRGFLPAPLCSIRTVKADVVSGLEPGVKEHLDEINSNWMISGKYAVIQCAIDGR